MSIERFSHGPEGFWRDPEGLYVEYSDHKAALDEARSEIEAALTSDEAVEALANSAATDFGWEGGLSEADQAPDDSGGSAGDWFRRDAKESLEDVRAALNASQPQQGGEQ